MSQLQFSQPLGSDGLRHTKFTLPRLHSNLVARAALLDRLNRGLVRQVTLVAAPAGFGKTTLVSQWLMGLPTEPGPLSMAPAASQHHGVRSHGSIPDSHINVAYVALDSTDNDPVRFWRYLIAACRAFEPTVGTESLPLLQHPQPPSFEVVLTALINELAGLDRRSLLILDDYHAINACSIHHTFAMLLDHLPERLHLVLLTRSEPPLPLARLRARNRVTELRAADLRFSAAETAAFLELATPLRLASETVERVHARIDGWAAGLRLATLALEGRTDPREVERLLSNVTGSHHHIAAFLVEEVLGAQPEPIQQFLLHSSVLGRLSAPLCDAVLGRDDSAVAIDHLERANLFITSLDDHHGWYRYHALFATALRHEARRRLDADGIRAVHARASRWYEDHGLLADAIEAALAAQELERAAALIEQRIAPWLVKNEYHTLRCWLEQLPDAVLRPRPSLAFAYALAILFTSDRRAPDTWARLQAPLTWAEQGWRGMDSQHERGAALALGAMVAWWRGDLARSLEAAQQALALLPEDETQWRGVSLLFVGLEQLLAGQLNAAQRTVTEARSRSEAAGNSYGALSATVLLGQIAAQRGDLHVAAQLYRQALATLEDSRLDPRHALLERGRALSGLAELAYEWNDLAAAEQQADEARDIGAQLTDQELLVGASLTLARVQHARGTTAQAQQRLFDLAARVTLGRLLRDVQREQARLALAAGDLAAVERWRTAQAQHTEGVPHSRQEHEAVLVAQLQIAQHEAATARRTLDAWHADARAQGRARSELDIMVLTALAHAAERDLPQAREALTTALTLAQPEGYRRVFLDAGAPIAAVLRDVLRDVRATSLDSYVRSLMRDLVAEQARPAPVPVTAPAPPSEPLSPQEHRVLRLLAAGLSSPEIAQELVVSINTVKTQLRSIYRKLNVYSRKEAREAARHLGGR